MTKRIHEADKFSPKRVWQRGFYVCSEHSRRNRIIRSEGEWEKIHLYIEENPVNWENDEENPAFIG